ncbi:hypothetical protein OROGR_015128 [Orobanche gracilis]
MLEKKKLNLGQPILSVRKYSSTKLNGRKIENGLPIIIPTRLSPSVPVKIAGAVPFKWEKTPGKPIEQSHTPTKEANMETEDQSKSIACHSKDCDDETTIVDVLDTLSSRIESLILNSHMGGPSPTSKEKNLHSADSQTRASMRSTVRRRRQQHRLRVLKMKIVRCKEKQRGSGTEADWKLLPHCGLRPGICLTTSVCIVNPVPAKNECDVKSNDKIRKSETKENKKSICKRYEKPVITGVPEATHHASASNRKTFRELLANDHQGSPKELLGSVVHDKTLYLDTSNHQLNDTQRILKQLMQVADSSLGADQLLLSTSSSGGGGGAHINSCDDFNIISSPSSFPKTSGKWGMIFARKTQDSIRDAHEAEKETTNKVEKQLQISINTMGNDSGNIKYPEFPGSPPRLKSPSDSWLCRTLSSMYTENASRQHSYLAGSTKSSKPGLEQH